MSDFHERFNHYSSQHLSNEQHWFITQIRERQAFIDELKDEIINLKQDCCKFGSSPQQLRVEHYNAILKEQEWLHKYYCDCYDILLSTIRKRMNPSLENHYY